MRGSRKFNWRNWILAPLAVAFLAPRPCFASPSSALREYNEGKYDDALKEYEKLLEKKKDDPRLHFNAGTAAYRSQKFEEAQKQFNDALNSADLQMLQKAYYNRGNTLYHLGALNSDVEKRKKSWEEALRDFESTLRLNQQDADAQNNYKFVQQQLEQLKQQQQQQQSKDNKQDQNQDKNQQNQQTKNDQDKNSEQNKDQQRQQQQQQDQKNQPAKNDKQDQQNQEQQKQQQKEQQQASNQSKDRKEQQKQNAEQQKQNEQQQQANASKDKDKSQEQGEQQQAYAVGQMTPQQAQQLLDAQKNDEMLLPVKPEGKPRDTSKPLKDW